MSISNVCVVCFLLLSNWFTDAMSYMNSRKNPALDLPNVVKIQACGSQPSKLGWVLFITLECV